MIILDTNFLMYIIEYRIAHILEDKKKDLAVPIPVILELEQLSERARKSKERAAAKLAIVLLEKWNVNVLRADGYADDAIKELALKNRAKVATMDKLLGRRLKEAGVRVLKIRQKKHLVEE